MKNTGTISADPKRMYPKKSITIQPKPLAPITDKYVPGPVIMKKSMSIVQKSEAKAMAHVLFLVVVAGVGATAGFGVVSATGAAAGVGVIVGAGSSRTVGVFNNASISAESTSLMGFG